MRKPHRKGSRRASAGFTLVELMIVVIILGILAATIVPQFSTFTQDAKINRSKADIAKLETQLELFFLHMDRYPRTEEGLEVLAVAPPDGADRWRGPYIKELRPDPWGNEYQYRSPGVYGAITYDLWSFGADGSEGGEGIDADITNWRTE